MAALRTRVGFGRNLAATRGTRDKWHGTPTICRGFDVMLLRAKSDLRLIIAPTIVSAAKVLGFQGSVKNLLAKVVGA